MGKAENYAETVNWAYTPDFKTILIDTKRYAEIDNNEIMGSEDPETYLEDVPSSPLILADRQVQQALFKALGIDGTQIQLWHLRLHKSVHTEDSQSVDKIPDIQRDDWVIIDSNTHVVKWVDTTHPFTFGEILLVYIVQDKA